MCSDTRRVLFPDSAGGLQTSEVTLAKALKAKLTAVHITGKLSAREILEAYHSETLWAPSEGKKAQEAMAHKEEEQKELAHKALESAQKMAADSSVPADLS